MRKIFLSIALIISLITFTNCEDTINEPQAPTEGEIALFSTPSGATILIDGVTKGTTPDTVTTKIGVNDITFQLTNYVDTTVSVSVSGTDMGILNVALTPERLHFDTLRVWQTGNGSTAEQPSGIDLSAGLTVALSSVDSLLTDIYYTGSNFTVRSANYLGENYRKSYFKDGMATNLLDGVDAPEYNNTWETSMPDDVNGNFYFIYDNDGNYSKFRVINSGGAAVWGDPKWVDVEWIYIKAPGERNF